MILKSKLGMEGSIFSNIFQDFKEEGKEELIVDLLDYGFSASRIAKALGLSKEYVLSLGRNGK